MTDLNHVQFKPFNIPVGVLDTKMMYVPEEAHKWIKETSVTKGVRMTAVLTALINHANESEGAFKSILGVVFTLEDVLKANNVKLDEGMKERLNALDDLYIKKRK
jgi:hypothetical protein